MKKIYLHILNSVSVVGLIALGAPALAELYQPNAISSEQVMTAEAVSTATKSTTPMAKASTIAAPKVLPGSAQVVQAVESDRQREIPDVQSASMASSRNQVTSVSQLSDVQPTDWLFLALQAVVKRYGCLAGYPNYWMAGVAFRDFFVPDALAGIAAGQPFIENGIGDATQTNFDAFYNFPLNDNIRIAPLVQVISDPGNQSSNGTIVTGTLRTVFSF